VSPGDVLLLVVAGIGGGLTGSIAGLASLTTYPALLAVGLGPVAANVTNTVALVANGVGSALGSRPELRGEGRRVLRLCGPAALGGVVGATLLLLTPPGAFERVVPWLLAFASAAILLPRPAREVGAPRTRRRAATVAIGLFLIAIYGGYFGAAAGVLMLALLLVADSDPLPKANAIKTATLSAANGVAAVVFAFAAPVHWDAVIPLAAGCLVGSRCGPVVVRHAPVPVVRAVIAVAGLALALHLGLDAYGVSL
jgi:uncharacterized membrane protein YfcA